MSTQDYTDILHCPHCAAQEKGALRLVKTDWLACQDCERQYPIVEGIPVMLPEEGDKWRGVAVDELPEIEEHNRFVSVAG